MREMSSNESIHKKKSYHMLHFTGHLQVAQLKTEMQNINNYGIYIAYITL